MVGDIEVHVTSDLWLKHGHHKDSSCNGVILHVAMWQKGGLPVRLQDGRILPTVILSHYIINVYGSSLRRRVSGVIQKCHHNTGRSKAIDTILLIEGFRRFEEKAARFSTLLKTAEAGQVLYKGICRALGYAGNKSPFEALADRLPLQMSRLPAADGQAGCALGGCCCPLKRRRCGGYHDDYLEELKAWGRFSRERTG
jgi:hypothetical protein